MTWGRQNEVWALLFAVVSFERIYRLVVNVPLEASWGDGLLVSTAAAALALTVWFVVRWRREDRPPVT